MLRIYDPRSFFLVFVTLVTLFLFYSSTRGFESEAFWKPDTFQGWYGSGAAQAAARMAARTGDNIMEVFNRTLGFQEIRLISLPERTDKRDAFAVAAAMTGFDYQVTDGVDGSTIPPKALPYKLDQNHKALGCWRAHLNVYEEMVRNHISSTLIFEDDADWDVAFKAQLLEFAKGTRYVLNEPNKHHASPYGDSWDLLWIGNCGSGPAVWNPRRYVIANDPTVVPPIVRENVGQPDMTRWETGPDGDNSTRIIFRAFGGVCTASYAISLRGAQKALFRMSMSPFNNPIDWGLNDLCADKDFNFNCVSVFPQIVGAYRPAGNSSSWSDIGYGTDENKPIVEHGHSERLVFSTRMNIDRLLKGEKVFRSLFPGLTGPEMHIDQIARAKGREAIVPLKPEFQNLSSDELKYIHWDWTRLE